MVDETSDRPYTIRGMQPPASSPPVAERFRRREIGKALGDAIALADRPLMVLTTALRAMGLLAVDGEGRFLLTRLAREHLVPGAALYVGDYVGLAAESPGVLGMVDRLAPDILQPPTASRLARLSDPGRVRRRVCGLRLGQGLGSSRTRDLGGGNLFLNPHIAWYRKSNPVTGMLGFLTLASPERVGFLDGKEELFGRADRVRFETG